MVLTLKDMTFKAGQELTISGKAKSGCEQMGYPASGAHFSINIGHASDDIALHFNPRFNFRGDSQVVICNSKRGGWGDEQREQCFPFEQEESFKVVFSFNNEQFYVKLPNGTMMSFPNRFGDDSFRHIEVKGDVKIQGIKIK